MKKSTIALISVVVVLAILVLWFFGTKNSLVSLKEDVEMQQSQIETALQRRSDLIPNLVNTIKGYTNYEASIFKEITDARSKLAGSIKSGDIDSIHDANNEFNLAINNLLALAEDNPELQASEQFIALQDELAGSENRISQARQLYNEKVRAYNTKIQQFPSSIVAGMSGYYPLPYFEADDGAHEVPEVNFD